MRFQRPLEIITLALALTAVISAQCISRNNPTRYQYLTWVECNKVFGAGQWMADDTFSLTKI